MSSSSRSVIRWLYIIATVVTFLSFAGIIAFELYVRWLLNQDFSALASPTLAGLAILVAAQMLGLMWLSNRET